MATKTYTVHRTMQDGAREYVPGDTREMTEADAAELVALGALSREGEEPMVPEPGVRHTFGEEPSTYTTYTAATGEPIDAEVFAAKAAGKPVKGAAAKA